MTRERKPPGHFPSVVESGLILKTVFAVSDSSWSSNGSDDEFHPIWSLGERFYSGY